MDNWLKELSDVLHMLLGNPKDPTSFLVLLVVALVALFIGMHVVGSATGVPNLGLGRRLLALMIGVPLLMIVWVAAHKYLLPRTEVLVLRYLIAYGIPLAAGMLVVVPIQQWIFRGAYQAVLITFIASLVLAALMIILTNAILQAVSGGEHESEAIEKRNSDLERIINNS